MDKPLDTFHVNRVTLWYDATAFSPLYPANEGFDKALELLKLTSSRHPETIQLIDSSALSRKELVDIYFYHAATCPWWKYKVRRVFGSNREPEWQTATRVPPLTIKFDEDMPEMVAPYADWQVQGEPVVPILKVFKMLSAEEQTRLFGRDARLNLEQPKELERVTAANEGFANITSFIVGGARLIDT
ncbi:hypothetical protein [Alicyclobacillus sp. SO9]|uniref:hypothetical protein n=1 Tax=Alicyclobacillus sp. SO9 TaxID=2665646 RepID=UPI0018E79F2A|nr:hypothetical protein [Alicyclobacillus sp. SO9]QQE80491.1 hypothetical protein GI364_08810 [Alicyclobacillus sp. SO9]